MESCATAFEPQNEALTRQWIAGFLSGAYSRDGGQAAKGTDVSGIIGEVRIICQQEPSRQLVWATQRAYAKLRNR